MKRIRRSFLLATVAMLALVTGVTVAAARTKKTAKNPVVVVTTSMGTFKVELYADKTPITVANFLSYVDEKFYDGTVFHRVIEGFMIQGGGFDEQLVKKPTHKPIENEAKLGVKNAVGTIAMARTSDPNSATSQFFVNVATNRALDHRDDSAAGIGYCAFGKVISGLDVVKKIALVETGNQNGMGDVPVKPVIIQSIRLAK